MKIKNWYFAALVILVIMAGCSKPDDDANLSMPGMDPVSAVALNIKAGFEGYYSPVKGIADTCKSQTFPLIAGQHTTMGTVVVSNDAGFLYVTFNSDENWDLDELHLFILDSAPTGRLAPGQAPYKVENLADGTHSYTFAIPLDEDLECGRGIWIQAHAATGGETAYGGTISRPVTGGPWFGTIYYEIECCEEEEECDLSASAVVTDVKCFGASTGNINVTVSGGTAPYTFIWNTEATTEDLENIPAGEYSVTIYDAAQCMFVLDKIMVLQPASGISASSVVTQISAYGANDGAIDVTVSGGTPPYNYLWSNGATTQDLSALGPGIYSVVITDANGCSTVLREIFVEEPDEEEIPMIAFARKTYEPMVHCFLGEDFAEYDFNQWGWTNGALAPNEEFTSHYELWTNVDGCGIEGATKVGYINMQYSGGTATAVITMIGDYTMSEARMYIGNDILPVVDGNYTVDPADYPYVHAGLGGATTDTFTVNGLNGDIYIIGYVVLGGQENNFLR